MNKLYISLIFLVALPLFSAPNVIEMQEFPREKTDTQQPPSYNDTLTPDEKFAQYDRLMRLYQTHYTDEKSMFEYREPALKLFELAYKEGSQKAILVVVKNFCQCYGTASDKEFEPMLAHVKLHIKDQKHEVYALLRKHELISSETH